MGICINSVISNLSCVYVCLFVVPKEKSQTNQEMQNRSKLLLVNVMSSLVDLSLDHDLMNTSVCTITQPKNPEKKEILLLLFCMINNTVSSHSTH